LPSLNVGCGDFYADGWVNIDRYTPEIGRAPDLVASVTDLPYPDGHFDRVYLGHILEHIEWDAVPAVLEEVRRVVHPGGTVMVVGPDLERAVRTLQSQEQLEAIIHGPSGDLPGVQHEWTATELLTLLAARTVFPDAVPVPLESLMGAGWPVVSFAPWQCAISCPR
jgi:predicted SAM-dependent methyltransferase